MILIGAGYWINQRNLIVQEASRQTELAPLRELKNRMEKLASQRVVELPGALVGY